MSSASTTPQRSANGHSATSATSSSTSSNTARARQYAHLNSQLAQLSANMADLENIMRMTAVQARAMRELGGYAGAMLMASSKVLGEEMVTKGASTDPGAN